MAMLNNQVRTNEGYYKSNASSFLSQEQRQGCAGYDDIAINS